MIFQQLWEPTQSFFLDKVVTIGLGYLRSRNSGLARLGRAEAGAPEEVAARAGADQAHRTNRITGEMLGSWLTEEESGDGIQVVHEIDRVY